MKNILLIVIFVAMFFLVGCTNKKEQEKENWVEYGKTDSGIAYYDVNSLNNSNNIVTCKVKFDTENKTYLNYVVITYQIDYNKKNIMTMKSISVDNKGKETVLESNVSGDFEQYAEANKNANIINVIAQYYKI